MNTCGIKNDNKFYIQTNELCSFKALHKLKTNYGNNYYNINSNFIFDDELKKEKDLNINYRNNQNENEYIYKYDIRNEKKDLCNKINKNEWIINCAIENNNPLYTYDNKNKNCSLISDIKLPEQFKYVEDISSNYIKYEFEENEDNKTQYSYKNKKGFCENKWYDWIIVPNYHFGNQYEKDIGNFSKEDIRKCYKPCIKGYLPYFTSLNNEYICIPKEEAEDGIFKNKLDYSPIALINLIGNSYNNLNMYYFLNNTEIFRKYSNNNNYEINNNIYLKLDNNFEINEAIEEIKKTINLYLIDDKSMNARNIDKNINVITYKNPLFNENDIELITLRGMDNNNMMTDIILIHTYYLAYIYNKFYQDLIKQEIYYNNENINYEKIINHNGNIKTNLNKILNYDKNKYQRLANILFKSINICYDEKTDFSKNLLDYTKLAYKRFKDNNIFNENLKIYEKLLKENPNKYKKYNNEEYFKTLNEIIISKIEIPYISTLTEEGNKHISNYILINIKEFEKEKDKIELINFYENKNEVIFYTLEDKERINKCNIGEIYNKETKKCENCKNYCNIDKCKTDINCNYFCEDNCKINKEKEKITKCGIKKVNSIEINKTKEKIETPIEENLNIPEFSLMLKSAIKIVLALLFLYMCYIFYQMYGETIITIYNWIELNIVKIISWIKALYNGHDIKENYNFMMKEYIRNNITSKYERVASQIKYS